MSRSLVALALAFLALPLFAADPPTPAQPVEIVLRVKIDPSGGKAEVVSPAPADADSDSVRKYKQRLKELGEAAEAGRLSLMRELLQGGADANDKDDRGRTPLHRAVAKGNKAACATLLAYGADVGEKDADGVTPLMLAAEGGDAAVVELLLTPRQVVKAVGPALKTVIGDEQKFEDGMEEKVKQAKKATDKLGQTAGHKAAAAGQAECLKLLWQWNTSVSEELARPDKTGRTPVRLAAAGGHVAVFDAFTESELEVAKAAAVKAADGKTPLDAAREGKHSATVARLEMLALLASAAAGDVAAVEAAHKADPKGFPAQKVVHVACREKQLAVLKKVQEWYADKPAKEKEELFACPREYYAYPAQFLAANANWAEGVAAVFDRKWWNDDPALAEFTRVTLAGLSNQSGESAGALKKLQEELKAKK